jgi:predicted amidohydrolase
VTCSSIPTVAVLPELALDPWTPATRIARDEDAEAPGGPRHRRLSDAARAAGVAVVGGAIVRDPVSGARHNTALAFDAHGVLVSAYRKVHLPEEEGFWETSHYAPGDRPPAPFEMAGATVGVQICSDVNRPVGSHLLAAEGAEAILAPRATEPTYWERWKLVLRATALTCGVYVLTVNRREPGLAVPLGGPSAAFDPSGATLVESEDHVTIVPIDRDAVAAARRTYPGYLPHPADLYAAGWASAARRRRVSPSRAAT